MPNTKYSMRGAYVWHCGDGCCSDTEFTDAISLSTREFRRLPKVVRDSLKDWRATPDISLLPDDIKKRLYAEHGPYREEEYPLYGVNIYLT
jgi:hypothetical protein